MPSSGENSGKRHGRSMSDYVETSRSSDFIYRPGFWAMYMFLIGGAWLTLRVLFMSQHASVIWTITLQSHAIISWILLHWIKGTPEANASLTGEDVAHLTFWEQIDGGKFYGTKTRRLFIFVPIVLFFLSLVWTQESIYLLVGNAASTFWLLLSKMESARGVRLLGINELHEE